MRAVGKRAALRVLRDAMSGIQIVRSGAGYRDASGLVHMTIEHPGKWFAALVLLVCTSLALLLWTWQTALAGALLGAAMVLLTPYRRVVSVDRAEVHCEETSLVRKTSSRVPRQDVNAVVYRYWRKGLFVIWLEAPSERIVVYERTCWTAQEAREVTITLAKVVGTIALRERAYGQREPLPMA